MHNFKSAMAVLLLLCGNYIFSQATINGELRKWHTVTILFNGPVASENDATNPFLDFRLNVTFTAPNGQTTTVPGFFAADGNAAQTGANSGNKWAVRFTPDQTGQWSYLASFRSGANVAVDLSPSAGTAHSFDGTSGSFTISANNKSLPDNRAQGRLNLNGSRYLRFQETGTYFIKAGADSPENLLAYGEFDNTVNSKTWGPHVQDWNTGDPSWQGGKGKGLIGAVNYLATKGMNVFSFLTKNVIGDGKDVWPWAATSHDQLDGNSGQEAENKLRYDVSKLEQWEILFDHADKKGMFLHFKTQETENKYLLDNSALGTQRKLYYRELIARFGHHLALNWNLGEEFDIYTPSLINSYADYISSVDPYDHHIVIHSYPGSQGQLYNPLLGSSGQITGPSIQSHIDNVHDDVKHWIETSANSGKQWVVANDEQGGHQSGVTADADYPGDKGIQGDNRQEVRHKALWGTLMAGGTGVEYYFGYQTGETDLTAEDWRSRESKWEDAKIALDFFRNHLPYWEMDSQDQITSASSDYCFAKNGEVYAIYLPSGGTTNIDLTTASGAYTVQWFNPQIGGGLLNGNVTQVNGGTVSSIGNPPNGSSPDWVAILKRVEGSGGSSQSGCEAPFEESNGLVIIEAENQNIVSGWNVHSTATGYTGNGYLEWEGGDNFGTPGIGTFSTSIKINQAGTYLFRWRNKIGHGNEVTESNDTWLRFPDADDYFGMKPNGSIIYPHGSGKTPNPNGAGSDNWFKIYVNSLSWSWDTYTSDHDGHQVYVTFNSPGVYTMEISGRSNHHLIDRIVLAKDGIDGTNLSLQESLCEESEQIAVTGISISPGSAILEIGNNIDFNHSISPSNATNQTVIWSSSDPSVATVDSQGTVLALSEGSTTITVTSVDGNHSSTATVTVEAAEEPDPEPEPEPEPGPETNCDFDYEEKDEAVVIEAENMRIEEGWSQGDLVEGASGNSYIIWQGPNHVSAPGQSVISTRIKINSTGTYKFQWRNKVGKGQDSRESNDTWLRFADADSFYGEKDNASVVYPEGAGQSPVATGAGPNGWLKIYSSGTLNWTWSTNTNDESPHDVYVTFNNPGIYTMEISGRSNGHIIDRIVLSKDGSNVPLMESPETACSAKEAEEVEEEARAPILDIQSASAYEGESIDFRLTLDKASDEVIELDLGYIVESADLNDFSIDAESVVFEAGETEKIISVLTVDDQKMELDETFTLAATELVQGDLSDYSDVGIGTILNEDKELRVTPNPAISNNTVLITGVEPGLYELSLIAVSGKLLQRVMAEIDGEYEMMVPSVTRGIYVLKAHSLDNTYASKLFVQD